MIIQVLTPEQIKREAQACVVDYDDVNLACRFPFESVAGQIFRDEFVWQRQVCNARAKRQAEQAARAAKP